MNKRRKILIALGASALASPLTAYAQNKVWRIGHLSARSRPGSFESDYVVGPFLRGMAELGYVEGKNLVIEWRFADSSAERLLAAANELAQLKMDAIMTENTTVTQAARKATATIPIVMISSSDPVRAGFVASLARPGGNITGLTSMSGDVSPKQFEMLLTIVPKLSRVAVLMNPANSGNLLILKSVLAAAWSTNAKILPVEARTVAEIEKAFATMARENVGAVIVAADSLFNQNMRQIVDRAAKQRLPSIAGGREFAEAGGLMSYGRNQADSAQRAAVYVDKILKGAKPADLPVEQPTKFEMFINGKTAKSLGLKIPQSLLISADKVIQ